MHSSMRTASRVTIWCLAAVCLLWPYDSRTQPAEPDNFFRKYVGLNDEQITVIERGGALAKILDSPDADEVFVFGAVHIAATPEDYLQLAGDISRLRKLPNYLAIRRFSEPPQLSDLEGFTLEDEDVKQLKNCKPGKCEVQLPAAAIEEFQKSVSWSSPDAAGQANHAAQRMALQALLKYREGGDATLGTYEDKDHPTEVAATFETLLKRSKSLPAYLPELDRYLLEYPKTRLPNVESQFYWEKVNFGLKPTLRIVQVVIYRGNPGQPAYAVAVKQLYSSHYFHTALDLSVCVRDTDQPDKRGFYLITLKGSQQAGLTGFKGSILRKVAVDKSRSSLERVLQTTKQQLESRTK
jgi:hypothetical protein